MWTWLWCSAALAGPVPTLQTVMADPSWIGAQPETPSWTADSRAVDFTRRRPGRSGRDGYRVTLGGTETDLPVHEAYVTQATVDPRGRRRLLIRHGDVFLETLGTSRSRQLTRTGDSESDPRFLTATDRVAWRNGHRWSTLDLKTGVITDVSLLTEDDPDAPDEEEDFLVEQQRRLFSVLSADEERERLERQRWTDLQHGSDAPIASRVYLGDERVIRHTSMSPDGEWLLVVAGDANAPKPTVDTMPAYVTGSGYLESESVRAKVGAGPLRADELLLVQPSDRQVRPIVLGDVPGLRPSEQAADSVSEDPPAPRPIHLHRHAWSEDGQSLAVMIDSSDHKDRWVLTVDVDDGVVTMVHHEHDDAWVSWAHAGLGWLEGDRAVWFTSEHTGWQHLYTYEVSSGAVEPLTEGRWVVGHPESDRQGRVWFTANEHHPGVREVYRVQRGSDPVQITELGGRNRFLLSPDERRLLVVHSERDRPPELWTQPASPGAMARQLTHSLTSAFEEVAWTVPELVSIEPTHASAPIYARHYAPEEPNGAAILFIHGAGYMQSAHAGWSYYFREFMFHTLLVERGYHVLDVDYRASAGYGRDWRTAIYRNMGRPEVEDLADGVAWLVGNHGVSAERVGAYGGSYGGFLTLMALFTEPDLFACGAALRPVTDWAHYEHSYTSAILDTPKEAAEAYAASSPIEHAEGLTKPLLIAHGMLDDNVLFEDTVRLTQRLIELEKEDWEVAMYPMEAHGFREPSSWLDEYRRVDKLFRSCLESPTTEGR